MYGFIIDTFDMGRKKSLVPTHCHHKGSGRSYITWNGTEIYTGLSGSIEAAESYAKMLSNIMAYGEPCPKVEVQVRLSVATIARKYLEHVKREKPPDSDEDKAVGRVVKDLERFDYPAERFSPGRLTELIQMWVDKRLALTTINKKHNYLLNIFRWAAQMDLVTPTVWSALLTVRKIKPGRSSAKQPKKVKPVACEVVESILDHCQPRIAAVLRMQLYTGMRCGEVLRMTMAEIHGNIYSPYKHKNRWRNKDRTVHLGPRAMALINEWKTDDPHRRIFTDMTSDYYGRWVKIACKRAKVPHFTSHQIRHYHATMVRAKFGLDAAQAALGHSSARTTEIYAEVSTTLGKMVSEDVG
jgi:integrase